MKIKWTNTATRHLQSIYEYIAKDSSIYAQRMIERLIKRSEQIASFPLSGCMVPEYEEPNIREIIEGSYRIIYRMKSDQIDILSVIHGASSLSDGI